MCLKDEIPSGMSENCHEKYEGKKKWEERDCEPNRKKRNNTILDIQFTQITVPQIKYGRVKRKTIFRT